MLGGATKHELPGFGPLERKLQIVLPRETHCAVQLQPVPEYQRLALPRRGFGHRRREPAPGVIGGDRQRREVGQRPGPLDRHVHVGGFVLDSLEGSDRDTELLTAADVFEHQIKDALAGADHGDCHARQRNVLGALAVDSQPVAVGDVDLVEGKISDMQYWVEHG